ncbi:hypothetical protein [Leucobacter tenebrionis]|uniref:hypothetical protein n=1 Tax=Leucobacter tenebrionis TaxID=2873270 RepID=UPI001CA61C2D|nr:hypothetical protein [Leucobacter tenebrionis]QZY52254.1 hypothetical protein KVY00_01925 [Leucobacter tenebrionis]
MSEEFVDPYPYPGSHVLRNLLDQRTAQGLAAAEYELTLGATSSVPRASRRSSTADSRNCGPGRTTNAALKHSGPSSADA